MISAPNRHTVRVYDRIRRVSRFSRQASHARAACAGSTSAILVLAMTVQGGHGIDDLEALALASIVGVLAFLTWTWTDRSSRHGIARRADERLGLGGGLLAAFENATRPERPMAELGARRALGRAPFSRLRAAAVPPFEVFLVLPLIGGVALFRAIEARDEAQPAGAAAMAQVGALATGLQRTAAAHPGELSDAQLAELAGAVAAAQAAAQDAGAEEIGDAMRDVAEALDEAAASLPPGSALGEELERLAFEAEAAAVDTSPTRGEPQGQAQDAPQDSPQDSLLGPSEEDAPSEQELAVALENPGAPSESAEGDAEGRDGGGGSPEGPAGTAAEGAPDVADAPDPEGHPGAGSGGIDLESSGSRTNGVTEAPKVLDSSTAAPAPWWPDKDDDLVRAWLDRAR